MSCDAEQCLGSPIITENIQDKVILEHGILLESIRRFPLQPRLYTLGQGIATVEIAPRSSAGKWRSDVDRPAR